jgi:hypothetical protein
LIMLTNSLFAMFVTSGAFTINSSTPNLTGNFNEYRYTYRVIYSPFILNLGFSNKTCLL